MQYFWQSLQRWSRETFGPPSIRGPVGPLKHLEKEAREAYDETSSVKREEEIADCLFLVFDAAQRAGMSYDDLADACVAKLRKNMSRHWQDWRKSNPLEPIEHDRTKDK